MRFFLLFICTIVQLHATSSFVRVGYGYSSQNDLGQIISGTSHPHPQGFSVATLDYGHLLTQELFTLPIAMYGVVGTSHYFEQGYQPDINEVELYLKFFYTLPFTAKLLRLGAGEGVSYVWGIPTVEALEAQAEQGKNSKFLNYLDLSIELNIQSLLFLQQPLYIGATLKHRSGIYGLINDVNRGGSNYTLFTMLYHF